MICNRCVMDTSDPDIVFDKQGVCNHCTTATKRIREEKPFFLTTEDKKKELNLMVERIKLEGKKGEYDCIIGLSGGVDSTYLAYVVKNLGLRPLAVHLDNGWNSELSVVNIQNICKLLSIDLYTYVIDWEEFRKLQVAFLKSSTPDSEIPTDHAIVSTLFDVAKRYNIKTIIRGNNISTESIMPKAWSQGHFDWRYIKGINKKFGGVKLKTFPHSSIFRLFWDSKISRIKYFSILNYLQYNKSEAKKLIEKELLWKDYGYKHYESNYTKIYQSYILTEKFGFDKRRAHFSSLIITEQMKREEALDNLKMKSYDETKINEEINYLVKKLGISLRDFEKIMKLPHKSYFDYPNNLNYPLYILYKFLKTIVGKLVS